MNYNNIINNIFVQQCNVLLTIHNVQDVYIINGKCRQKDNRDIMFLMRETDYILIMITIFFFFFGIDNQIYYGKY